jgi:cell fate regulator YaaT (PSP1 superfamily)
MACSSCGTGGGCGSSGGGCQNAGLCASGSCNKMNSYDWISTLDYDDPSAYEFVEVSFKNGARKEFYKNPNHLSTGDTVLVEVAGGGYDIGKIALSGDLVRLQIKKKYTHEDRIALNIIRRANERDLEKLENKVDLERQSMVLARAISASLDLDIKIGDVEYQGDMKKATFFFTANGRVDFRELVRAFAKEFKVKIEMRQIGSRQESARIGGIGSCGRELCCSTWLSDFRSVNTTVARYQNIAINQTKLSGQCGRLKCCLNYELDAYVDALQHFPSHANVITTKKGRASLVKTDIFKGLMFYVYEDITMRGVFHPLDKEKVKEILALNKKGIYPEDLSTFTEVKEIEKEIGYVDVTGEIELPSNKKKKKKPQNKKGQSSTDGGDRRDSQPPRPKQQNKAPQDQVKNEDGSDAGKVDNQNQNRPQNNKGPRPNNPNQNRNQPQNEDGSDAVKGDNPNQNRAQNNKGPRPNNPNQGNRDQVKNEDGTDVTKTDHSNQNRPQNNKGPRPNNPNQNRNQPQNEDGNDVLKSENTNLNRPQKNKGPRPNNPNQGNRDHVKKEDGSDVVKTDHPNRPQNNGPRLNNPNQGKLANDAQNENQGNQKQDAVLPPKEISNTVNDMPAANQEGPSSSEARESRRDKKKFFNKNKNKNNQ